MPGKQVDKHTTSVGALFNGTSARGVLIYLGSLVAVIVGVQLSGDQTARAITIAIGLAIAVPLLVVETRMVVGGIGLLKRRRWAPILLLPICYMHLFLFPIGTVGGMYSMWMLMKDDTVRLVAVADDSL